MTKTHQDVDEALAFLRRLGASSWLLRHHEIVVETCFEIIVALHRQFQLKLHSGLILSGAALHDCGKISFPIEMSVPGSRHHVAGRDLLIASGKSPELARFCVTHGEWLHDESLSIEDLIVALADSLWKGKRDQILEARVLKKIVELTDLSVVDAFMRFDDSCEEIALRGAERLDRSSR